MLKPDLAIARRFVDRNAPEGRVLMCGITGAHHYGFPSENSDMDLKGIFLVATESLLGLDSPTETIDKLEDFEGVECDMTLHEGRKALMLLLGGNGNILERILSPFQLYRTPEQEELQHLARASLSSQYYRHYRGYFSGMCREVASQDAPTAKRMLYSYRVALTGIHLLRTGELEADVNVTAPEYGFAALQELVAFKRENGEKSPLPAALDRQYRKGWERLEEMLEDTLSNTMLPEEPPNVSELSEWLKQKRLDYLVTTG